jgi:epoxyqueuosine reductase QueG
MSINASLVKEQAISLGSDLCGIASIDRFQNMPQKSNPLAILPQARSVIVIAKKFLTSTTTATSTIPYTIIRNWISREIDEITIRLAYFLEETNHLALPTGAIEPCNYDKNLGKSLGLISLKNAAHQAGLGVIGKNTLLITPQHGNMVWLGAVISSAELEPDPILQKTPCSGKCNLCVDNCPVSAIDGGLFMDQTKCKNFAFGEEDGGEWRIKCTKCRVLCPASNGYRV